MGAKGNLAGLKNKAIAAFIIISVIALLYVFTGNNNSEEISDKKTGADPSKCETAVYNAEQVKKHNKCSLRDYESNDFWVVIEGYVHDVSEFIIQHPGGEALCTATVENSGQIFKRSHFDWENIYTGMLKPKYCIGKFVVGA